jgi:hypothetical protein
MARLRKFLEFHDVQPDVQNPRCFLALDAALNGINSRGGFRRALRCLTAYCFARDESEKGIVGPDIAKRCSSIHWMPLRYGGREQSIGVPLGTPGQQ